MSRIEAENNCEVERAEKCQVWRGKKVEEGKRSVGYEAGTGCHLTVPRLEVVEADLSKEPEVCLVLCLEM